VADQATASAGKATGAETALVEALHRARLQIDTALKGLASGQPTLESLRLSRLATAGEANSGCNTSCGGGGGSGCVAAE
jgi:hypothetical protein